MTVKGGNSPACAACKYQRRRCSSDCALSPYFPADQTKAFQNAHRLFGVSNIMKILKQLNSDEQRDEAMKSIKYEADMRERYPVYGCAGIICQLRQQLKQAVEELHHVYAQLDTYRGEQVNYRIPSDNSSSPSSNLQLGINIDTPLALSQQQQQQQSMGNEIPFLLAIDEYDDQQFNDDASRHLVGVEPWSNNSIVPSNMSDNIYRNFEEMHFDTTADDRQSSVETKDACESSSESSFRDFQQPIDQISKIELRNAAACFSLKNIK